MIGVLLLFFLEPLHSAPTSGRHLLRTVRNTMENKIVCNSQPCRERATKILGSMDQTVDPCENFYSHVCGRAIKETGGEGDASGIKERLYGALLGKWKEMLDALPEVTEAKSATEKLALPYKVCMNSHISIEEEVRQLKIVYAKRGVSDYPILKGETTGKRYESWEYLLLAIVLEEIFIVDVIEAIGGATPYIVLVVPKVGPEIHSPVKAAAEATQRLLIGTAQLFKPKATQQELSTAIEKVLEISKQLAQLQRSQKVAVKTIKDVESEIPKLPLLRLLNAYFEKVNITLQEDDMVTIKDQQYITSAMEYLVTQEPGDVINYIVTMANFGILTHLSEAYLKTDMYKQFQKASGIAEKPRWIMCVLITVGLAPEVATRLYVQKHFDLSKKAAARHVLNIIGKSYYDKLTHVQWVDHQTRQYAIKKLWNIKPVVGYSDTVMNEALIEEKYKKVTGLQRTDSLITIADVFTKETIRKSLSRLRKGAKEQRTEFQYELANSVYVPTENSLSIFAGMLQDMYFDKDLPISVNLGAIGFEMAHQIGHAFDRTGMSFDENGNGKKWWSNYTKNLYEEKQICFKEQYGNITDPLAQMPLDGVRTLDENIADNAAIHSAIAALRTELQDSPTIVLPGLEKYSSEQLFFISFAMPWCTDVTSASLKKQISTDIHAPNKYRVNVPLMNSLEFSAAFQCKKGSAMRLADNKRCSIW